MNSTEQSHLSSGNILKYHVFGLSDLPLLFDPGQREIDAVRQGGVRQILAGTPDGVQIRFGY